MGIKISEIHYGLFRVLLKRDLRRKKVGGWTNQTSTDTLVKLWRKKTGL